MKRVIDYKIRLIVKEERVVRTYIPIYEDMGKGGTHKIYKSRMQAEIMNSVGGKIIA